MHKYTMQALNIIITGPESSGKTTLAEALSQSLQLPLIPEYAREYLLALDRKYTLDDVLHIGKQQMQTFTQTKNTQAIIYDTDVLTTIIWLQDKFNYNNSAFNDFWNKESNCIYLLCKPEFIWEEDPLREDEGRSDILYEIYKSHLITAGKKYFEISGNQSQRIQYAKEIIAECISE
ncbi:MAG: ATP-binding protein [Bacteroidetes bacterium]|nr:ATP-binding protein [Bacteroidota bacterium]MBP7398062.1 ATP-binding protein [Chitinophagales bacterium]MBK7109337.1 ATP-binding protein [Bacteroidota bacterium]MBK8487919.1 ATP-binding protein [Bacteroidota bacterium]MBK8682326.1 ATP-binding protein [Bacteroidota bacterium]